MDEPQENAENKVENQTPSQPSASSTPASAPKGPISAADRFAAKSEKPETFELPIPEAEDTAGVPSFGGFNFGVLSSANQSSGETMSAASTLSFGGEDAAANAAIAADAAEKVYHMEKEEEKPAEGEAAEKSAEGEAAEGTAADAPADGAAPAEGAPAEGTAEGAPAEGAAEEAKPEPIKAEDRLVQCPGCSMKFHLSELIDAETGQPLDLASLIPAEVLAAATRRGRKIRAPKPKKKQSMARMIISVIIGGLLAVPLAHYISIPIQVALGQHRYGLFKDFPTPGVPFTYKVGLKKHPWFPKFLLPFYDAENPLHNPDLPDPEPEEAPAPEVKPADDVEKNSQPHDWSQDPDTSGEAEKLMSDEPGDSTTKLFGGGLEKPAEEAEESTEEAADDVFSTREMPSYKAEEVEPLLASIPETAAEDTLTATEDVAKKLTVVAEDEAAKAVCDSGKEALKKLATAEGAAETLGKAGEALLKPENHGKGIVLVGKVVDEPKDVRGLTVLKIQLDGTDKKIYVVHKHSGDFAKDKRYVMTGIVVDSDQDANCKVSKKGGVVIWRGLSEPLD